jgi:hypothetical protein
MFARQAACRLAAQRVRSVGGVLARRRASSPGGGCARSAEAGLTRRSPSEVSLAQCDKAVRQSGEQRMSRQARRRPRSSTGEPTRRPPCSLGRGRTSSAVAGELWWPASALTRRFGASPEPEGGRRRRRELGFCQGSSADAEKLPGSRRSASSVDERARRTMTCSSAGRAASASGERAPLRPSRLGAGRARSARDGRPGGPTSELGVGRARSPENASSLILRRGSSAYDARARRMPGEHAGR